jgi:transcriptional antiterminator RfaH
MDDSAKWHAVYTRSRSEKKIAERLREKGIEAYVPLRKVMRQWSDRKKLVLEPLIRSYVFVKIFPDQYFGVLNTPGAVRYIFFAGKAATIPDRQIEVLRMITGQDTDAVAIPDTFKPGTLVRVIGGPLRGLEGEMIHAAGRYNIVIRISHIDHAISLTISPVLLEPLKGQ